MRRRNWNCMVFSIPLLKVWRSKRKLVPQTYWQRSPIKSWKEKQQSSGTNKGDSKNSLSIFGNLPLNLKWMIMLNGPLLLWNLSEVFLIFTAFNSRNTCISCHANTVYWHWISCKSGAGGPRSCCGEGSQQISLSNAHKSLTEAAPDHNLLICIARAIISCLQPEGWGLVWSGVNLKNTWTFERELRTPRKKNCRKAG